MLENGRERAAKIDRRYHAAFDRFLFQKRWMSAFGLFIGLSYSAWMFSSRGALQVSTGQLSQPHFAWNQSGCENCHLPNIPIRTDASGGQNIANIARNNQQCNETCHAVTNHFASQTKPEMLASESCSSCHREHLGYDRSLVEVSDRDCARCHADMAAAGVNTQKTHTAIRSFSADGDGAHPEFKSLQTDPGTIRFSHIQHMRPGQPKELGGAEAKTLEMLPEKYRAGFKDRVSRGMPIQLTCSDCHSRDVELKGYEGLESVEPVTTSAVQSSGHMLYKPIEFEKHCVACHTLDGLPHALNRAQTSQAIRSLLPIKQLEQFRDQPATPMDIEAREMRLLAIMGDGGETCKKCHQPADELDSESLVKPSQLNVQWLRDASFTHGAHLMVACRECHAEAYASTNDLFDFTVNRNSEMEANQVMIAGLPKCRECHIQDAQARSKAFAKNKHIASADCVDCHRYHVDPPSIPSRTKTSSLTELHRFLINEISP